MQAASFAATYTNITIQELPSSSTGFSRRSQAQNIRENSTFFTILFHKFWAKIAHFGPPLTPPKSALFQERGRKRMKEWDEVTFMKEWVKALDKTRILAPADIKFVVSFPRYGHLKIPKGPNQISLVYFRAS